MLAGQNYTLIPTKRGKHLLMLNGYTYAQIGANNFYCSKKRFGCKARVNLDNDGKIYKSFTEHEHDPPKYMVTADGKYVKI